MKAISHQTGISADVIAHRLMGDWKPTAEFYGRLIDPDLHASLASQPYPFCLAYPIEIDSGPESLGESQNYVAEWKWDGIRGQVIRRNAQTFIWSRGEELMENRWPEIELAAKLLPNGTVWMERYWQHPSMAWCFHSRSCNEGSNVNRSERNCSAKSLLFSMRSTSWSTKGGYPIHGSCRTEVAIGKSAWSSSASELEGNGITYEQFMEWMGTNS